MIRDIKYHQFASQDAAPISLPTIGAAVDHDNFDEWMQEAFYNPTWENNLIQSLTWDDNTKILTLTWNDSTNSTVTVELPILGNIIIEDQIINLDGNTITYQDGDIEYTNVNQTVDGGTVVYETVDVDYNNGTVDYTNVTQTVNGGVTNINNNDFNVDGGTVDFTNNTVNMDDLNVDQITIGNYDMPTVAGSNRQVLTSNGSNVIFDFVSYNDLTDVPAGLANAVTGVQIGSGPVTASLVNGPGAVNLTSSIANNAITNAMINNVQASKVTGLATVATTGAYSDLSGIPATFPPSAHTHVIADVTGLQTALDGKVTNSFTASRALISNGSGNVAVSAVTSTELGYLDGVTSAIQTQLNGKVNGASNLTTSGRIVTVSAAGTVTESSTALGDLTGLITVNTTNFDNSYGGNVRVSEGFLDGASTIPAGNRWTIHRAFAYYVPATFEIWMQIVAESPNNNQEEFVGGFKTGINIVPRGFDSANLECLSASANAGATLNQPNMGEARQCTMYPDGAIRVQRPNNPNGTTRYLITGYFRSVIT